MKTIGAVSALAAALAICVSGCSSDSLELTEEQIQQVITYYTATNGSTTIPINTLALSLCHLVYGEGSGANSQSNIVSGGVPECGGLISIGSSAVTATPNSCVLPASARQGYLSTTVRCQPLSDFGPVTSGYTDFGHSWNPTGSLEAVSAGKQMSPLVPTFNTRNAFYLSGMGSMSVGNEYSWITYDSTNAWVNSQGFKGLSTTARVQRLGRAGGITHTLVATPGNDGAGPSASTHTCLVTQVNGALDNGGFELEQPGGSWNLRVWDGVTYGRADCYAR